MKTDRTEISWDNNKSKWLVRIIVGEEVIRRFCDLPRNAAENELRSAAQKTLADEGYESDGAITVQSSAA
jgi:hypothetical protein